MAAFSVIIPTYNRPHLAVRAVQSALRNICEGDEIIVIDDGSEENYAHVIPPADLKSVRYLKTIHQGVSAARNHGLKIAKNDYIAFLDDDDEWYSNHLASHRAVYASRSDVAGVFCNFDCTKSSGELLPNGVAQWSRGKPPIQELLPPYAIEGIPNGAKVHIGDHYKNQLTTDYILPSSFSFNRLICGSGHEFCVGLDRNETWLFNSHVFRFGPAAFVDCTTCVQHGDAVTRLTGVSYFETLFSRLKVMQSEWGRNPDFLAKDALLYDRTRFADFFFALRQVLRRASVGKMARLMRLLGVATTLRYTLRALPLMLTPDKVDQRIT